MSSPLNFSNHTRNYYPNDVSRTFPANGGGASGATGLATGTTSDTAISEGMAAGMAGTTGNSEGSGAGSFGRMTGSTGPTATATTAAAAAAITYSTASSTATAPPGSTMTVRTATSKRRKPKNKPSLISILIPRSTRGAVYTGTTNITVNDDLSPPSPSALTRCTTTDDDDNQPVAFLSLPPDIILEIAQLLTPSSILNLILVSPTLHTLLLPSLYHTFTLPSSAHCCSTLPLLLTQPTLCSYIREMVLKPNYYLAWPKKDTYLDETWVAKMVEQIAKKGWLTKLEWFEWEGLEVPRDDMWEALRLNCTELKNISTHVGKRLINRGSKLFDFSNLTSFSLIARHNLGEVPSDDIGTTFPNTPLPDKFWDMILNRCPNLTELTICSFSPYTCSFNILPLLASIYSSPPPPPPPLPESSSASPPTPPNTANLPISIGTRFPKLTNLTLGSFRYQSDFTIPADCSTHLGEFLSHHPSITYLRVLWNFRRWVSPEDIPLFLPSTAAVASSSASLFPISPLTSTSPFSTVSSATALSLSIPPSSPSSSSSSSTTTPSPTSPTSSSPTAPQWWESCEPARTSSLVPKIDTFVGLYQQLAEIPSESRTKIEVVDLTCEPLYEMRVDRMCDVLRTVQSLKALDVWVHLPDYSERGGGSERNRNEEKVFAKLVDACMGLEELHFMCTMPFTKKSLRQLLTQLSRLPLLRRFSLTKGHTYTGDESMLSTAVRVMRACRGVKTVTVRWAREKCLNHLKQEGVYEVTEKSQRSNGAEEAVLFVSERGIPLFGRPFERRYRRRFVM